MKENRRDFIKKIALGSLGASIATEAFPIFTYRLSSQNKKGTWRSKKQHFNMCGYRAPKLDKVRVGFIGIGKRGYSNLREMTYLEGVEIAAICDIIPERVNEVQLLLSKQKLPSAKAYLGSKSSWRELCENPNIDLISIAVPRGPLHAAISIYAMECGKHVAVEVPAIETVDEAWNLVETSEKTKQHCMMLENCCYDFFELLTLNMVRQGFFGDLVHADAAYIHHQEVYNKPGDTNMWRLEESQKYTGNLYPTHGLGPVCQAMNINRGDKFTYMVSMSSDDFMTGKKIAELAKTDSFYDKYNTNSYNGNMNTSVIRTEKGRTIMLQYDTTSPRSYSRIHMLSGTKAACMKYPFPARISVGSNWVSEEEMKQLSETYMPEIYKRVGSMAKRVGGHGGMDFVMTWRLIDCLRNGLPLDQDVYDAAAWSVIIPLSKMSVGNKSKSIEIPDFTRGSYKTNTPLDVSFLDGGNTVIRNL